MSKQVKTVAATVAAIALTTQFAQGSTITLDQVSVPSKFGRNSVATEYFFAQSVTAGETGRLHAIEVLISTAAGGDSDGLTLSLHNLLSDGSPDLSTSFGQSKIARSALPQIKKDTVRFDIHSLNYNVNVGDEFAFVLTSQNGICCSLLMHDDVYDGGFAWLNSESEWINNWDVNNPDRTTDLFFKTYVDTPNGLFSDEPLSSVPLPASIILLASAFLGFGALRKVAGS